MNTRVSTIIKNTGFLYIRLIFIMVLTLYTSRVILNVLGVGDFGVYSVVGSVTATFASLRTVLSEALIRFLNYEKGKGNNERVRQIFNLGLLLHAIVAFIFLVIVEIVGLWLLYNKLNIPIVRFDVAVFVFHISVISSIISIFTVPYDAVIIANEKINVFAIVSMFDAVLKLVAILLVPYIAFDQLKSYSLLMLLVPTMTLLIYTIYSKRFPECNLKLKFSKGLFREIGVYATWNFIGNFVYSMVHEAFNMLLNMFGSVIDNAARSLAYQVRTSVNTFSNNALVAVKPYVIQESAVNENNVLFSHILLLTKVAFYLSLFISVPVLIYCRELMYFWLLEVPENAVIFTQLSVVAILIRSLHGPLSLMYMSLGKIKWMTIVEGSLYLLSLLVAWGLLYFGCPTWSIFVLLATVELLIIIALSINAKIEVDFCLYDYFLVLGNLCLLCIVLGSVSILVSYSLVPNGFISLLLYCMFDVVLVAIIILLMMNKTEKSIMRGMTTSIVAKFKKSQI